MPLPRARPVVQEAGRSLPRGPSGVPRKHVGQEGISGEQPQEQTRQRVPWGCPLFSAIISYCGSEEHGPG